MNPPSIDVDGLRSNLSYQILTAQEGYRDGHSEFIFAFDNSKSSAICPSSSFGASPQAPVALLARVGRRPLRTAILTLANGAELRLDGLLFFQKLLIGRGSCVHATATCNWSTTEDSDTTEGTRITDDSDIMEDIGTTGDGDTTKDSEKPNHAFAMKHIPDMLHYKSLNPTPDNAPFRQSEHLKRDENQYENRVLQISVIMELLPNTELKTSDELIPAIRDIFKSYRLLYEHTNIVRGDISLNSLKCRKVDSNTYGVLIDYDLLLFFPKSKQPRSTKQRTGTSPYMAIDLLEPTPTKHLYRHDLESLFYVIVVLVTRYDEGKKTETPPLQRWFQAPPIALREVKESFLRKPPPQPTTAFESFRSLLFRTGDMFHNGYEARDKYIKSVTLKWMREKRPQTTSVDQAIRDSQFNDETLGGNVDFDKFQTILLLHQPRSY